MIRLFTRLYLAVAAAILLGSAAVMTVALGMLFPQRAVDLRRELEPGLRKVAQHLATTAPGSAERARMLETYRPQLGPTLALLPVESLDLDSGQLRRLAAGKALVTGNHMGRRAYVQLADEPTLLELELFGVLTAPTQWLWLVASVTPERSVRQVPEDRLSRAELLRASQHPTLVELDGERFIATAPPNRGRATSLSLVKVPFSPDVWIRWLAPAIMLLVTALALALVLRPLHRSLRQIDGATARFGAGDLHARTGLRGPGAVEQLGQRFDQMADRVRTVLSTNEELLRAIAHELRTPIGRLYFSLDLLETERELAARGKLTEQMRSSLEELRQLTSELLDYCRLEAQAPKLRLDAHDPAELMHSAASAWSDERLHVECAPVASAAIECDARLITRALANLVSNALRYCRSRVQLECGSDDVKAWFRVDDDGPGIPEAERGRLTRPFERLDESRARTDGGGVGLGLAIVRRVAELHGGHLRISHNPWGGARVVIELPQT